MWWWNRIARWDTAAHIRYIDRPHISDRTLADIRDETIVEVARWNLTLAEQFAQDWSGDPAELAEHLGDPPLMTNHFGATFSGANPLVLQAQRRPQRKEEDSNPRAFAPLPFSKRAATPCRATFLGTTSCRRLGSNQRPSLFRRMLFLTELRRRANVAW